MSALRAVSTFGALVENANQEHARVCGALRAGLGHAISCGAALTAAKEGFEGESWTDWLKTNDELTFHSVTANWYMRIYRYRDQLAEHGIDSFKGAMRFLRHEELTIRSTLTVEQIEEVRALVAAGERPSDVAREFEVARQTVHYHTKGAPERKRRVREQRRASLGGGITDEQIEITAEWLRNRYGGAKLTDAWRNDAVEVIGIVLGLR